MFPDPYALGWVSLLGSQSASNCSYLCSLHIRLNCSYFTTINYTVIHLHVEM